MSLRTFVLVLFIGVVYFGVTKAQFEDCRCKCVCPGDPHSKHKVNVTVVSVPALECTCQHVTGRSELECLRCECKFEVRSTTIIKIVVIFVLVLIGVLLAYLIALLIMDPGMLKRSETDRRRQPQEVLYQDAAEVAPGSSYFGRRLGRVGSAQKRWQHKVKQQRQDVFQDHTLLS
ncbi:proton-transporting V-type ATPase complex assembly regulator TMEM9-like [Patiria miniata]|uniref:Transmembrane protein 9 n=1 Tax=Patiria miniata TaxID=46514 RepID=A0A913ZBQ1_PATMI|nr:proton-transporting V-type ATPase complex assembly regulator TMEM9-like [Patiria miniata]